MKLIAKKDFSFSTDGCTLVAYPAGTEIETDHAELIEVSVREGWAESPTEKADKAPANKARKAAPENK
jgi:hypothetical protein